MVYCATDLNFNSSQDTFNVNLSLTDAWLMILYCLSIFSAVDCPVKQRNQSPTQEVKSNSQRPTLKLQLQMMSLLVLVLLHALF